MGVERVVVWREEEGGMEWMEVGGEVKGVGWMMEGEEGVEMGEEGEGVEVVGWGVLAFVVEGEKVEMRWEGEKEVLGMGVGVRGLVGGKGW
ncbi:hypothetical protein, partial [Dermacoccus nishinomiyaensis]|uniref:hypothetical protein n=1 Tax=Dermacoccus nishinomiyaensis TaxID=1274 RepID=UPI001642C76C